MVLFADLTDEYGHDSTNDVYRFGKLPFLILGVYEVSAIHVYSYIDLPITPTKHCI